MPYIQRIHCTVVNRYALFYRGKGKREVLNHIKRELSYFHNKICIHTLSFLIHMSISVEHDKQNIDVENGQTQL